MKTRYKVVQIFEGGSYDSVVYNSKTEALNKIKEAMSCIAVEQINIIVE